MRRILRAPAETVEVLDARALAQGSRSRIVELTLRTDAPVAPGDVVSLCWRNAPAAVAARGPDDVPLRYWSTPTPHRPSFRTGASRARVLSEVLDLGDAPPDASLRTAPRMTPRLFTTSDAREVERGWRLRLQVTAHEGAPPRAAAFLHGLRPGDRVSAWVLPHPHRLTRFAQPGLAVVTGSGAAAVFAALRSGSRGLQLVWGLGDKVLEPWMQEELRQHRDTGALRSVEIVRSPERVTAAAARCAAEVRSLIAHGGWIFVSGNDRMAHDVDALIRGALGADLHNQASRDLRYIVSA